jgi:hypothetical protein
VPVTPEARVLTIVGGAACAVAASIAHVHTVTGAIAVARRALPCFPCFPGLLNLTSFLPGFSPLPGRAGWRGLGGELSR